MSDSKEYMRELLKRAIPDRSGEIINFRELRNLLEASIEKLTGRKSFTHHSSKSADEIHHLLEEKGQNLLSEDEINKIMSDDELQKLMSEDEKDVLSADEATGETIPPKTENEIQHTEEKKHDVSPVRSEITEQHVEPQASSKKHEEKSSVPAKKPSVGSKKSTSQKNSNVISHKPDTSRHSIAPSHPKTEETKTSRSKPSKGEKSDHKKSQAVVPVKEKHEVAPSATPESHPVEQASSPEENNEPEPAQSEETNDEKPGSSGTTEEKKPPLDGDRKRPCDDGELLLIVQMPKDFVCNTNDQSEFRFKLKEEDFKKAERQKDT